MYRVRQGELPFRGSSHHFVGADNGDVNVSVFLFHGLPGSGPGPHRHPYDEVQFIQSGRGLWVVNDKEFEAGAGDILDHQSRRDPQLQRHWRRAAHPARRSLESALHPGKPDVARGGIRRTMHRPARALLTRETSNPRRECQMAKCEVCGNDYHSLVSGRRRIRGDPHVRQFRVRHSQARSGL